MRVLFFFLQIVSDRLLLACELICNAVGADQILEVVLFIRMVIMQ